MRRIGGMAWAALVAAGLTATASQAQAAPCTVSDLSFGIGGTTYLPSACRNSVTNGNPRVETTALNDAFGTSFVYLDKTDDTGPAPSLGGLRFTISATPTPRGSWTLGWEGGGSVMLDLVIGIFAGGQGIGYLFEDVVLPAGSSGGTGAFVVAITNHRGAPRDLSHMTLLGGDLESLSLTTAAAPAVIPEPAALALLLGGLAALGFALRRRRAPVG